jgi:hypothetical protein
MREKKVCYKEQYISDFELSEIRDFYHVKINDSIYHSNGPYTQKNHKLGWQGCWDRSLHLEILDNPIHNLIAKLKDDFDDFIIDSCSVRYLSSPFLPHTDVVNLDWIQNIKQQNCKEGWIFLIPLSFVDGYRPGTAFLTNPPDLSEPLYCEMLDILPNYSEQHQQEMKNFSVRQVIEWKSPGDLIAWENFQWHCSCQFDSTEYHPEKWVKEFISIKTYSK